MSVNWRNLFDENQNHYQQEGLTITMYLREHQWKRGGDKSTGPYWVSPSGLEAKTGSDTPRQYWKMVLGVIAKEEERSVEEIEMELFGGPRLFA